MEVSVTTAIDQIKKTNERVVYLYNHHPSTVESDDVLIYTYEKVFGPCGFRQDSIKRAGRNLRHKYPDRYKRTEEKQIKDRIYEQANKEVYL